MNRITYELGHKGSGEYDTDNSCNMPANNIIKALNKLGQLEDFEEKLGIDLITFLKALTQECIYVKCDDEIVDTDVELGFNEDESGYYFDLDVCHLGHLYLKDYGKTWALTKEELE